MHVFVHSPGLVCQVRMVLLNMIFLRVHGPPPNLACASDAVVIVTSKHGEGRTKWTWMDLVNS